MATLSDSEQALKQRIIQLFKEKGAPSRDGNSHELLLKDIWNTLKVEKRTVNRILHNSPACFTKVKDSPPLWQCKVDQTTETSPAVNDTPSTATNTSVDAEPDVVVKKKEEVDSPSKKERLKPDVLQVLNTSSVPMTALQIAKTLEYETAGDVNPTLYALRDEEKVTKTDNRWSIKSSVPNVASLSAAAQNLHIDATPMKVNQKTLYTREDTCEDGRDIVTFREVLTQDVIPKDTETDGSKQPLLTPTQPDPIDDEMLSLLSSLFDDPTEFELALKIVNILKASGDTPLDDADIFTKLGLTTRLKTRPVLDSLELNGLVEKISGEIIHWKWKRS